VTAPTSTGQHQAAVATAFPLATEAALEILQDGGNAIDAGAAAAWALCACEPSASGLGGQTVLLFRLADGRMQIIDGHSRAPMAASPRTVTFEQQRSGHRATTVPSTPAVLDYAQRKYGVLARARVMEPAIRVAEDGYAITPFQHQQARWVASKLSGAASELFLPNRSPPPAGHLFHQRALARTLRRLARCGCEDFYSGAIARLIVDDMRSNGGLITEQDLADCISPLEREPISASYREHRIFTVPPPGGGAQLLLALQILERLGLAASPDYDWYEGIALTTSAVFRERERSFPDLDGLAPSSLNIALSGDRARQIAAQIINRTDDRWPEPSVAEQPGDTTHLSVSDRQGNIVLLTQSIQSVFGAKVANPHLGFLYNNYLCTCPRHPHPFALAKNCQPRSNAAPTLVLRNVTDVMAPFLGMGSAGSRRIISSILQVVSRVIDRDQGMADAVAAARVHGLLGRKVWIERPACSKTLIAKLLTRSREPVLKSHHHHSMGSVQALHFLPDGRVTAAADPRRDGAVATLRFADGG
jgi:gamma-glutamyltranspeptidase / glutathione hydrolase